MSIDISIIMPLNNEEGNVNLLYSKLNEVMKTIKETYELIFVDDGSNDKTYQRLCEIYDQDSHVNIIRLSRNFGQSSGLAAGFHFARGRIIITMDGDLQHDPGDIPRFLEKINLGYDLVSGWKRQRADNLLTKRIPSWIVNKLVGFIFGIKLHDICCSFKAYRKGVLEDIKLSGELHRFTPLLIKRKGGSICEIEIECNRRKWGKTHYGLSRIKRVISDILALWIEQENISKHLSGADYSIAERKFHP